MSAPAIVDMIRETVEALFPWLPRIRVRSKEEGGALEVKSAAGKIELEGPDGLPVARKTDGVGYFYAVVVMGAVTAVYWSEKNGTDSAWTLIASGALPPVDGVTTGTPITITTGSAKVTCG